jgi:predicted deacetylase
VYLLVVPHRDWSISQLDQLRHLQQQGYPLAGHGLTHHVDNISGIYHRLHSRIISKQVAEHLALNEDGIVNLITDCYHWFLLNHFKAPELYVPPAWAMGSISKHKLQWLPFRWYEYLHGIHDSVSNNFKPLPVIGFEAENYASKTVLKTWNYLNTAVSTGRHPLRISIHPNDFQLPLQADLVRLLNRESLTPAHLNSLV